ncbi:MAG: LPP20 family lipoprotein, partial [Sphaerochaetaceae bacterium]|nr:LPP20 family lipoprotein [Sphaerochaetaceae bacterium]
MKKLVLVIIVVLFSFASIFAGEIVGVGKSSSLEDARTKALSNLASSIQLNVTNINLFSSTSGNLSNKTNSKTASSSYLYTESLQMTNIDLLGVIEKIEEAKNEYTVTCIIKQESGVLYQSEIKQLVIDIENRYLLLESISDFDNKVNEYLIIIGMLKKYSVYRNILLLLDQTMIYQEPSISKMSVESEYQMFLQSWINEDEITLLDLERQANLGILSNQSQRELDSVKERITAVQARQEELK